MNTQLIQVWKYQNVKRLLFEWFEKSGKKIVTNLAIRVIELQKYFLKIAFISFKWNDQVSGIIIKLAR